MRCNRSTILNLVRFAHNWDDGSWNDGFKEISIQNANYLIDFLVLMEYFTGNNQKKMPENRCLASIIKKSRFNISFRAARFSLFMPNIPLFHHSMRLIKTMAVLIAFQLYAHRLSIHFIAYYIANFTQISFCG